MSAYREQPMPPVLVVAFNGRVFGVDLATGEARWEHNLSGVESPAILVTSDAIYAASERKLTCLRYPDGKRLWSVDVSAGGRATLLLEGDRIVVAHQGEVACFTRDGARTWHNAFTGKGVGVVALGTPGNVAQADQG